MARRRQRYRIVWTLEAADDLKEIHDYIARNSTTYAQRVVQKIASSIDVLRDYPRSGPGVLHVSIE
jgi:plasmid stabilization system protein ParE